jgi:hypothetical protein
MNPLKTLSAFYIPALFLFSACSEKDEFKPYLEGDIIGYAYCFDEYGNEPEDFSGIKVYTEPDRKYSTVTDEDGRYVLKNVINGTYNLSFEKQGFGTMKLRSVQHLGGKPTVLHYLYRDEAPFLYENITTQITNLEYSNDSIKAGVAFSGQYKPDRLNLRLFFSTEENFDIGSAMAVKNIPIFEFYDMYWRSIFSVTSDLPFGPGETVYYKACIYTTTSAIMLYNYYYISGIDTYYDSETNTTIYPNLSDKSDEFSFTMP